MLAQLKTAVLIKEAIKLAFFRRVEYLEHQHLWVRWRAQNSQKQITFFWNSSVKSGSQKEWVFHARNCQETEDLVQRCVLFPSQNSANCLRIEGGVGGPGAQLSKGTSTLECLVWETEASQDLNWQLHPQNPGLKVNSEEPTPGCGPSRQSCKENAISQTGQ